MKGMLWQNTFAAGLIIIVYYLTLLIISYIFSVFDATPILNTWRTAWDPTAQTFFWFFLYFVIPVLIAVVFIVFTKPQQEVVVVGGYR